MGCQRSDLEIEAYVDGECPPEEAAALREHFRTCASCRRRAEELSRLQELVHDTMTREGEPDGLWDRISSRLDEAAAAPSPAAPSRLPRLRSWLAAAAVVLAVAMGAFALRPQPSHEQVVVRETVQDFVTFQLSGRPFDSALTDPAAVRAWFADKIKFELPVMKALAAGYELIGSRLCWLLDRRLGAFTYKRGDRLMTLYVMAGDEVALPGGRFDPVLGAVAARHSSAGHNSLVWRRGDLLFSLVSDAPDHEMTAFAAAVLEDAELRASLAAPAAWLRG